MRRTPPVTKRLQDDDAEIVRRNHEQRLREREAAPEPRIVRDVSVMNNANVFVSHGLGRAPVFVQVSAIRWDNNPAIAVGTVIDYGAVDFQNGQPVDRTQGVLLGFVGFSSGPGIKLTVDVLFL